MFSIDIVLYLVAVGSVVMQRSAVDFKMQGPPLCRAAYREIRCQCV